MKLTIELVPETSFYKNVRSEVPKDEWDIIRRQCYRDSNYICEICGGKGKQHPVECHEIWKYNDNKLIQKLIRFIALCPSCHQVKHIGLSQIRGIEEDCIKHLMRVNKISESTAEELIWEAFDTWRERSNYKWELDISYLKKAFTPASKSNFKGN